MGSCAAPSAKGDDKFITTDYLQQCPLLCVIQPLFGDTARSLCVKTESFFWWQDFAQLVVPSQKRI
ncbi:hypothetical protein CWM82_00560 [Klebsiella pneumoniae]|nr:hypothetical protein CWM82_00560 [Klebsiella pneumoniae]